MATHSMGSHRVRHYWSDLAAAAALLSHPREKFSKGMLAVGCLTGNTLAMSALVRCQSAYFLCFPICDS